MVSLFFSNKTSLLCEYTYLFTFDDLVHRTPNVFSYFCTKILPLDCRGMLVSQRGSTTPLRFSWKKTLFKIICFYSLLSGKVAFSLSPNNRGIWKYRFLVFVLKNISFVSLTKTYFSFYFYILLGEPFSYLLKKENSSREGIFLV